MGLARICSESSAKLPKFLLETVQENLDAGGSVRYAALVIAACCYYSDKHADRFGTPLEVIDERKDELHAAAGRTGEDPLAFLRQVEVFGDLAEREEFGREYVDLVGRLYADPDVGVLMGEVCEAG